MSPSPETVMDVHVQAQSPPIDDTDDDDDITVEDVVTAFLAVNPTPTDEQVHTLAALLGLPFEDFEAVVYQMFSDYVDDPDGFVDDEEETMDIDDDGEPDDPVEVLLVCFFAFHPDPTDVEIHQLAGLIDMSPEELEEVLYAMLARANSNDEQETETMTETATEPSEQETEFPYQMDQLHTP